MNPTILDIPTLNMMFDGLSLDEAIVVLQQLKITYAGKSIIISDNITDDISGTSDLVLCELS